MGRVQSSAALKAAAAAAVYWDGMGVGGGRICGTDSVAQRLLQVTKGCNTCPAARRQLLARLSRVFFFLLFSAKLHIFKWTCAAFLGFFFN